jgi:hypothetical protein
MSDSDFDRDDELRALLRAADPVGPLSPADPAALEILLEDIMSADLDVRPVADEGSRASGTHGRNRLTWLVAAASVAAIAAGGAFAVNGLSDSNNPPPQATDHKPSVTGPDVAGQTTVLGVSDQQGKCAVARPDILAQYDQAFQGTVTSIEGDTVTLATTEVLNGEVGDTVQVTAPQGLDAMLGTVDFQVGQDYLVAAYDGQMSQCYSGSASGDLRSPFDKAFIH